MMDSDGLSILSGYAQGHPQNLSVSADRVGVLLGFSGLWKPEKNPSKHLRKNLSNSYKYLYGKIVKTERTTGRIPERQRL